MKLLILNGPNLNLLGLREPEIYGSQTLKDIEKLCYDEGGDLGFEIDCRQSNYEGELVNWIQEAVLSEGEVKGIIINAGAYTHTSVAIHDALKMFKGPIIEVHLSNPKEREDFRHFSYIEPLAAKVIAGRGADGYVDAIKYLGTVLT